MASRQQLEDLIKASLTELATDLDLPALTTASADTILFGSGGALDSLALVHLIADIETRISDEFDRDIVIADERAMSRSQSPFRTVATLTDYLQELLQHDEG